MNSESQIKSERVQYDTITGYCIFLGDFAFSSAIAIHLVYAA